MPSPTSIPSRAARQLGGLLVLALVLYVGLIPLRPEAWGGPRWAGPFEDRPLPTPGWLARDARLVIERLATARSPENPLAATAEGLLGFHALLIAGRYVLLAWALRRARIGSPLPASGRGVRGEGFRPQPTVEPSPQPPPRSGEGENGRGGSDLFAVLGTLTAFVVEAVHGFATDDSNVGLLMFAGLLAMTALPAEPDARSEGERSRVSGPMLTLSASGRLRGSARPVALTLWFTLWANAHPSAVLGLVWLGVLAVGRTAECWRGNSDRVGRWWLALGLATLAACVNPDGPRLFVDAFAAAKNPNLPALPAFQPIDFSTGAGRPYVYLASLAALVVVQLVSPRAFSPTTLVVLLTFGVWPLVQQRGLDYWWLVIPWLAAPYLGPLCGPKRLWHPSRVWVVWVAVALAAAPAGRWLITGNPRELDRIVADDTPWRMADALKAGNSAGAILCGEAQGDFLAWALEGEDRLAVTVYTRPETIHRDHWDDTRRALNGDPDWWDVLDRLRVNWVVIDRERFTALADRLRRAGRWNIVRDEGRLLIAERRVPVEP